MSAGCLRIPPGECKKRDFLLLSISGVTNELKCFANQPPPRLDQLDVNITAWHGTADRLASIEHLKNCLEKSRNSGQTRWREFEAAGSVILLEHWQDLLQMIGQDAANP